MLVLLALLLLLLLLAVLPAIFRKQPVELECDGAAEPSVDRGPLRLLSAGVAAVPVVTVVVDGVTGGGVVGTVDEGTALGEVTTCDRSCGAPARYQGYNSKLVTFGGPVSVIIRCETMNIM